MSKLVKEGINQINWIKSLKDETVNSDLLPKVKMSENVREGKTGEELTVRCV